MSPDGSTSAGIKLCKRRTGEALWVDGRCEADAVLEEDCFEKRRAGQLGFAMSTNPWESILHSVYLCIYIYIMHMMIIHRHIQTLIPGSTSSLAPVHLLLLVCLSPRNRVTISAATCVSGHSEHLAKLATNCP